MKKVSRSIDSSAAARLNFGLIENEGGQKTQRGITRRTANIPQLPILKQQEVFALGDCLEPSNGVFGPVIDDVRVGLEDADSVADLFCDFEQLEGCVDIGGDAEVGALDGD